jgi:hypothetical protein
MEVEEVSREASDPNPWAHGSSLSRYAAVKAGVLLRNEKTEQEMKRRFIIRGEFGGPTNRQNVYVTHNRGCTNNYHTMPTGF